MKVFQLTISKITHVKKVNSTCRLLPETKMGAAFDAQTCLQLTLIQH